MAEILTIPKKLIQEGEIVMMPRSQYEEFLKLFKRFGRKEWEEKDTDEAVRILKKERRERKLVKINSLAELG